MPEPVRTAVILAAGRGRRMGTITAELPKPMVPVREKPLLEHILDRLTIAGVERFLVVVGYQHQVIENHFHRQGRKDIKFALQHPVNGTATAALLARDFAGSAPFILSYGDILCDPVEYEHSEKILEQNPASAAIVAVKEVDDPWQGAAVYEIGGQITRVVEKPPRGTSVTRWNSAGFYIFKPLVFDYFERVEPSPRGEYELTSALELMLADRLELHISPIAGAWRDIGRPEDLEAVQKDP